MVMRFFASASALLVGVLSYCSSALAANVSQPLAVQVTSVAGSKSVTKGYFMFTTAGPVAGCESGFWLPVSDANYNAYLAKVNDALATKLPLTVSGDLEQPRPGSLEKVCRITQLR
jgi:hypothetical protein